MSLRHSPLARTCSNIVYNLRQYRGPSRRPGFRALNHPFCTNSQLLEASYTNWIVQSSKDIPSKIFNSLVEPYSSPEEARSEAKATRRVAPAAVYFHQVAPQFDQQPQEADALESEILRMLRQAKFRELSERLSECHEVGRYVSVDVINEVAEAAGEAVASGEIEVPRHQGMFQLGLSTTHHDVYDRLPWVYHVFKLYESQHLSHPRFQQNYIWLCYHMNDVAGLQRLVHVYLQNSEYHPRSLSYLMSGFILNYDVEFAKNLFFNIIGMSRPLAASLLEVVVAQMCKVDTIFENIEACFHAWLESANCELPLPASVAQVLGQYQRFGTKTEVASFHRLVKDLGLEHHHTIRSRVLQHAIVSRDVELKKNVTAEDLASFDEIRATVPTTDKPLFYRTFLRFFARYSSIETLQQVIVRMRDDGVEFDAECFNIVVGYYHRNEQFLTLLNFVTKSLSVHSPQGFAFNPVIIKTLFDTYVQTYPYQALEFAERFGVWLEKSPLGPTTRQLLFEACQIQRVRSNLTPIHVRRSVLTSRKYTHHWHRISLDDANRQRCKAQVEFRINKGFRDVMRRGVRPDFRVLETTFRRLHANYRQIIGELASTLRYRTSKLELLEMQLTNPSKTSLRDMVGILNTLNAPQKIVLLRMLMNKKLYHETRQLLLEVALTAISDKHAMVVLQLALRNELAFSQFDRMNELIDSFPINTLILSPFIAQQCRYIEKQLLLKLLVLEKKQDESAQAKLKATLDKLRGLIGDIDARLIQDKYDLSHLVREMFRFLDRWASCSK